MTWAFGLFVCALAAIVSIQSLLLWGSRLENYPFSTPLLWEFILAVGVYGACASVIGAIVLLVVTVLDLRFDTSSLDVARTLANATAIAAGDGSGSNVVPCPTGEFNDAMKVMSNGTTEYCNLAAFGGNYVPGDAHLTFEVATKYPAFMAFIVSFPFQDNVIFLDSEPSPTNLTLVHCFSNHDDQRGFSIVFCGKWRTAAPMASSNRTNKGSARSVV